jgi:hypothetical protein
VVLGWGGGGGWNNWEIPVLILVGDEVVNLYYGDGLAASILVVPIGIIMQMMMMMTRERKTTMMTTTTTLI